MKEFLNIDELSSYLGIKKSTLYAKVANRQIPFYRVDRLLRFKKVEIDRWMETLKQSPSDVVMHRSRRVLKAVRGRNTDVKSIVRKSIDAAKDENV